MRSQANQYLSMSGNSSCCGGKLYFRLKFSLLVSGPAVRSKNTDCLSLWDCKKHPFNALMLKLMFFIIFTVGKMSELKHLMNCCIGSFLSNYLECFYLIFILKKTTKDCVCLFLGRMGAHPLHGNGSISKMKPLMLFFPIYFKEAIKLCCFWNWKLISSILHSLKHVVNETFKAFWCWSMVLGMDTTMRHSLAMSQFDWN